MGELPRGAKSVMNALYSAWSLSGEPAFPDPLQPLG